MSFKLKAFLYVVLIFFAFSSHAASTYKLYINPTPRTATIKILNIKPKFHQGIRLEAGRYHLEVSQSGYKTRRFWVELSNRSRRIRVTLRRDPNTKTQHARLFVDPHPLQARIKVLNIKPRFSQGMRLPPGKYELEISYPRFLTTRKTVTLGEQDQRVNVHLEVDERLEQLLRRMPDIELPSPPVDLKPDVHVELEQYALYVETQPQNASIQLLNTPIDFAQGVLLSPGRYQLKITQPGFKPRIQWVNIQQKDVKLAVRLSKPNQCFVQQQRVGAQQHHRHVRLRFYLDDVELLYRVQHLPDGVEHQFRFFGSQIGEQLDLFGTVYYDQQAIELHSQVQLQEEQLLIHFDGQTHQLNQIACDKL